MTFKKHLNETVYRRNLYQRSTLIKTLQNLLKDLRMIYFVLNYHIFPTLLSCFYSSPDTEALDLLQNLKTDFLPSKIPSDSIHRYTVDWTDTGIDPNHPPHAKYLDDFCHTFHKGITDLIDRGLKKRTEGGDAVKKQLYTEILQHSTFCATKCR